MFESFQNAVWWVQWGVIALAAFFVLAFIVWPLARRWFAQVNVLVEQGQAMIITKRGKEPEVTFTGAIVIPVISKAEYMDISLRTVDIDRRGKEGLICKDNIRADIRVTFFVRVNKTQEDVILVAQSIGCARASDPATLEQLFNAKFSEALKTVGKQMNFEELYTQREQFRDNIIQVIGRNLNGYYLEDAAIDFLEQTPVDSLDPKNILDAQGIKKITELTAQEHIRTNEWENTRKKQITKQDVEAAEMIFDLERQKADAEARKNREIATVQARERAETEKVQAEERLRSETARIKADEDLAVQEQNKQREVQVAEKNRERVIGVEEERVQRERQLEAVAREREVELQRIAKERDLEEQRKNISEVIRERIAVDKTVAEEEERIKAVRVIEDARRQKEATVLAAQAEAEEEAAKHIRAAEAAEAVSRLKAKEMMTLAEAEQTAADKQAIAKIRLAEGVQAEAAAKGLAEARVKEAQAVAYEKQGLAEARVKESQAPATEKLGLANVNITRERAKVEAEQIEQKLTAEARGLTEKAKAMAALNDASREHEEYRLRLENDRVIAVKELETRLGIAQHQAVVLGEAFKTAKIDIVGGDGAFLDRIVNAVSYGKAVDGFISRSETAQAVVARYKEGDGNLVQDVGGALSGLLSKVDMPNLTLAAALGLVASRAAAPEKAKLEQLLQAARALGIEEMPLAGGKPVVEAK